MKDGKAPLGFKIQDVCVSNPLGSKRIYNLNNLVPQNKFGFNPNQICDQRQKSTKQKFHKSLQHVVIYDETVSSKESNQYKGSTRPRKIASWSKSFIHISSIAGDPR
jgi:hypothetical protein